MIFRFIIFKEQQITVEVEADTKEQARMVVENDPQDVTEIDRKEEWEVHDF